MKKKSSLILIELSFAGMGLLNVIRNFKITSRLNKILFLLLLLFSADGYCCVTCNNELRQAIQDSVYTNIFIMCSAFIALTLVIILLVYLSVKRYKTSVNQIPAITPLVTAAMVLGIGLGGFADGIVFHQILQWHEMLSNKFPPDTVLLKSVNMFWDGVFHLFTLLTTLIGICLLWKAGKKLHVNTPGSILAGGMLAGWGIFNLIEGILNHQILELHYVRERSANPNLWNYGFLIFGLVLLGAGWLMVQQHNAKKGSTSHYTN